MGNSTVLVLNWAGFLSGSYHWVNSNKCAFNIYLCPLVLHVKIIQHYFLYFERSGFKAPGQALSPSTTKLPLSTAFNPACSVALYYGCLLRNFPALDKKV